MLLKITPDALVGSHPRGHNPSGVISVKRSDVLKPAPFICLAAPRSKPDAKRI